MSWSRPLCPGTLPPGRCCSTHCLQKPSVAAAPWGTAALATPGVVCVRPLARLTLPLAVLLVVSQLLLDEGDALHAQEHRLAGTAQPLRAAACRDTGQAWQQDGEVLCPGAGHSRMPATTASPSARDPQGTRVHGDEELRACTLAPVCTCRRRTATTGVCGQMPTCPSPCATASQQWCAHHASGCQHSPPGDM